ncbi:hypothetical protein EC957_007535 [Mortierella hygrophila]|uniref:Uncharacterized protein n=1 Tax=Mortierella hygrophila TaxID=979708 RepID=A0A9P6EXX5_9FUNG|nr:hypothetical protein EC957_007535 [Mortierella hygrophila]
MDTRRDNPSRHLTATVIAALGNPPITPLPPLPPLIPVRPSTTPQLSPPSEVVKTQIHRDLREEVTPLVRTWEPNPENISGVLRCSNIRLPCVDVSSGHGIQQPLASTNSLPLTSTSSTLQDQRPSLLQATPTALAAVSSPLSSASQLPASTEQNEAKSSFINLIQPIPPQSRTFVKNVPFLQRLSYAGSVELDGSNSNRNSSSSATVIATVDPFDSDRDVLSKVYILTTSTHSDVHLTSSSGQQVKHQLPPKYMLKVFPDKTPFKHAATRKDARNNDQPPSSSSSSPASRAVMRTIVQSAMEHELGAIEWAQKFLRRTATPNVLGYSLPLDRPIHPPGGGGDGESAEVTGVEKYGILGFVLLEFPAEGVLYQGPLEEFQTKESQQIMVSGNVAKAIYEMRSASCSLRVSGFSIHRRVPADDGSSKVVDGVSKPYSRFELIVDELRRRDAERMAEQVSFSLPDTITAQTSLTLSPTSSDARGPFFHKIIYNNTNKRHTDSGTAIAHAAAKDIHQSESSMTFQSSSSASSASAPTSVLIRPFLAPAKDPKRASLLMRVHKKTMERKMSVGEASETPLPLSFSAFSSIPNDLATDANTAAAKDDSQVNVNSTVDEPAPRRQLDPRRQETLQDDMLQRVAKILVNSPPPPYDALEACRRMSYSEEDHHHQPQPITSESLASLSSLQMLAAGTMRRVREPMKPKFAIRPSSTISVESCMRTAPYARPMKASGPKTWPDISGDPSSFSSSTSSDPFRTSRETKTVSWPKKFVEPANIKDGKPVYNSVADYEYARLVNALVALERLDSTPGSMNRFPKDLINILPRILRFVHQKEMLFSHSPRINQQPDCNRGKQAPVQIGNPAQQTAFFSPPAPPGLFEGIKSVFTHGQLAAQGSLVTDRKGRGVVAMANFQKAGFLPPYEEDMKGLFVKKVNSSFWNVPTGGSDDTAEGEGGGVCERGQRGAGRGAGRGHKAQNRMRKTASEVWPFRRFSKQSTFNSDTSNDTSNTSPTATDMLLGSRVEVGDENDVNDAAQIAMPARSISIHGKHPVPYPLLNHAIEHGSSCGNRYMVLVEASSPTMLSTSTSTSLTSPLSADSLANNLLPAQGLNAPRRFSVLSSGLTSNQITTAPPLVADSVSDTQGDSDGIVAEKSGSFRRIKSQFHARFLPKSKKNKRKNTYNDDDDAHVYKRQDPCGVSIEELIQDPASDDLFPVYPPAGTTTATAATTSTAAANSPELEHFPSTASASAHIPGSQPPGRPLMTDLPTFHTAPSSLSLPSSQPQSANFARSTTPQRTLLPEEPKICQVGWKHFLKTYCALETNALKAAAVAAAESSSAKTNTRNNTVPPPTQNAATNNPPPPPSPSSSSPTIPISFTFSTITFKESTYFHKHQLRALTDTINNRSDSMVALGSLVSLSKTLQNLVVALEAGGIVLTPEQLLVAISERQQAWQSSEEKRLAQIESQKEAERGRRIEAGERQEKEQEERMAALKLLREQLEQQQELQQKQGKPSWWQDDEIREIPPDAPLKDDPPTVPPKNNITLPSTSGADTEIDTGAGVSSAEAALSRIRSPRFGMLKPPSFLQKQVSITNSTATSTASTPVVRRLSHLLRLSSQPQPSSLTTSSISEGLTASTASAYHYQGRTPAYFIRSPDDDILYSAPGLQRDPLPSELPDHILTSTSMGSAFASGTTSLFDLTAVYKTDLRHKLGTMIAPTLPAYGVRLTNPDGTKTLSQMEVERIEREMQTSCWELEALCEYDGRTSWRAPPGIALLSMAELERQVEDVERWVTETKEGNQSSLLL